MQIICSGAFFSLKSNLNLGSKISKISIKKLTSGDINDDDDDNGCHDDDKDDNYCHDDKDDNVDANAVRR